jgi:hypothetical protein
MDTGLEALAGRGGTSPAKASSPPRSYAGLEALAGRGGTSPAKASSPPRPFGFSLSIIHSLSILPIPLRSS